MWPKVILVALTALTIIVVVRQLRGLPLPKLPYYVLFVAFALGIGAAVGHAGRLSLIILAVTLLIGMVLDKWGTPHKVKPEQYKLG